MNTVISSTAIQITSRVLFSMVLAVMLAFGATEPAQADTRLQEVLDKVRNMHQRVRTTLPERGTNINTQNVNIGQGISSVQSDIATLVGDLSSMAGSLQDLSSFAGLINTLQQQLGTQLDEDTRQYLLDILASGQVAVRSARQEIANFSPSACAAFRDEAAAVVHQIQALSQDLVTFNQGYTDVELSVPELDVRQILEQIPCELLARAAYAYYASPLPQIAGQVAEQAQYLHLARSIFDHTVTCGAIMNQTVEIGGAKLNGGTGFKLAANGLTGFAVAARIGAAYSHSEELRGGPLTGTLEDGEIYLGIHGYAGLTLTPPKNVNRISNTLKFLSETASQIGQTTMARVRHCELLNESCYAAEYRSTTCENQFPQGLRL